MCVRNVLAQKFIRGNGIEIGALNTPQKLDPSCRVQYVDQYPVDKLMQLYYMNTVGVVTPNIVDDGEVLSKIENNSVDFIIAGHFLEHARNLIQTIKNHIDKLKPHGLLFYVVPDMRFTFDKDRDVTLYEHLKDEYEFGDDRYHDDHIRDSVKNIDKLKDQAATDKFNWYKSAGFSIHVHVWTSETFMELMIVMINELSLPIKILSFTIDGAEFVCVLEKI
jgi:SAM-dependent methyltransferase